MKPQKYQSKLKTGDIGYRVAFQNLGVKVTCGY